MSWEEHAECREHNAEMWHSREGRGTALHICRAHCPVRGQCKQWATFGKRPTWAGQTVGGEWWVRRSGVSYPTKGPVDTDTKYCRTCRGDAARVFVAEPEEVEV